MKIYTRLDPIEATARLTTVIESLKLAVDGLPKIAPAFDRCAWVNFYEEGYIIADFTTREDFAPVRALAPQWKKTLHPNSDKGPHASYKAIVHGIEVNANVFELPPSCRLIEKTIAVPAHTKTVYEVDCKPEAQPA